MPITAKNIVRHELIGLAAKVVESADPGLRGVSGRVVDETYGTLRLEIRRKKDKKTDYQEKIIPKRNTIILFKLPSGAKVEVDGRLLVSRPEDRIKKKFKNW